MSVQQVGKRRYTAVLRFRLPEAWHVLLLRTLSCIAGGRAFAQRRMMRLMCKSWGERLAACITLEVEPAVILVTHDFCSSGRHASEAAAAAIIVMCGRCCLVQVRAPGHHDGRLHPGVMWFVAEAHAAVRVVRCIQCGCAFPRSGRMRAVLLRGSWGPRLCLWRHLTIFRLVRVAPSRLQGTTSDLAESAGSVGAWRVVPGHRSQRG